MLSHLMSLYTRILTYIIYYTVSYYHLLVSVTVTYDVIRVYSCSIKYVNMIKYCMYINIYCVLSLHN